VSIETVDLAVVPGIAFDLRGGRLGHGGGHIDRMLGADALRGPFAAGLAFECQIFECLPMGIHDRPMQAVVTETRTIRSEAPFEKER
jgi:5-formyltetrahydrofolate cyclo-ligase